MSSESLPPPAADAASVAPQLHRLASDLSLKDSEVSTEASSSAPLLSYNSSTPTTDVSLTAGLPQANTDAAPASPLSPASDPASPRLAQPSPIRREATGGPPARHMAAGGATGGLTPPGSRPLAPRGGGGGPPAPPPPTNLGSVASVNERARQMATTRLPPSLQAKLAANANRSASSPNFATNLGHDQRLDAAALLASVQGVPAPSMGTNSNTPGAPGLAFARMPGGGGGGPGGPGTMSGRGLSAPPFAGGAVAGSPALQRPAGVGGGPNGSPAMGARRAKPGLRLSAMGIDATPPNAAGAVGGVGAGGGAGVGGPPGARPPGKRMAPPGRLAAASGGLMSNAFSNFSNVVDPSGRLNFAGKAVLSASGVEFTSGTSFKINMEDLELQEELGKGNYGTVRKVRHTRTKVEMAMKEIRLELDESKLNAIIMELDILHRATAPEIVEFYGAFFIESCVYYCMEYMDAGSLENLYDGPCSVPEDVLARVVGCMVRGLRFLKDELQIMHRDVKPTNVLVNRRGQVKLCDFGVSGQLEKSLAKTNIGCQSYMAPERIKGESQNLVGTYTVASDVWSLGLSIVETTLGTYPYPPETYSNVFAQLQAIVHGEPPQLPSAYSDVARDFVGGCLEKVPERRFTYSRMLQHPFLLLDEERGEAGVDMRAWVERALEARERRRRRDAEKNVPPSSSSASNSGGGGGAHAAAASPQPSQDGAAGTATEGVAANVGADA